MFADRIVLPQETSATSALVRAGVLATTFLTSIPLIVWIAPDYANALGAALILSTIAAAAVLIRSLRTLAAREAHSAALAGSDLLSGLPNRLFFTQLLDSEIARVTRSGGGFALLYLDLDRFKEINDRYGHDAGDSLLVAATQRITAMLRGSDRMCRLGGDEFAIIQTAITDEPDAEALAARILTALKEPFSLGDRLVEVGASIGIAMCPSHATVREELMRLADLSLYRAKNDGRNRYSLFRSQLGDEVRRQKAYEYELAQAIRDGSLLLEYQPIMGADGITMKGVEALVRWPHPTLGVIPPGDFIQLAEERGLIVPLGEWVLRKACEDAGCWPGLKVAVNVSSLQFRQREFLDTVVRILEETGLDPRRLELELTESVIISDAEAAETIMLGLQQTGVRLALDDFGTGYSSLIYLRRFAFDKIKIDRSFIEAMEGHGESAIIVHSIVHLGRELGMTVTAEGIETEDQARFLQALGCHELQGFYLSPPVAASIITEMLDGPPTERTSSAA